MTKSPMPMEDASLLSLLLEEPSPDEGLRRELIWRLKDERAVLIAKVLCGASIESVPREFRDDVGHVVEWVGKWRVQHGVTRHATLSSADVSNTKNGPHHCNGAANGSTADDIK